MSSQIEQALQSVAEETFMNLAFMFPTEPEPDESAALESMVTASVTFAGPFSGTLFMTIPATMLPPIVGNMLGLEDETPSHSQLTDGMKEMLNVICGNMLPAYAGTTAVFHVHPPCLVAEGPVPETLEDCQPSADVKLHLEGGTAELRLFLSRLPAEERATF